MYETFSPGLTPALSVALLASPWHFSTHGKKLRESSVGRGYKFGMGGDLEMVPALSAEEAFQVLHILW